MVQKASEREAINTPIQWTAADVIKLAMIEVSNFLRENNMKSKMIIQVHDELVFNVPEWEIEVMNKEIPRIMEGVINEAIPLKVDWTMWKNWREAK
jgi:DNA polymerase-1